MKVTAIFKIGQQIQPIIFLAFSAVLFAFPNPFLCIIPTLIACDYALKQWIAYKSKDFINVSLQDVLATCNKVDADHNDLMATMDLLNKNILAVDAKLRSIPGWNQ